MAHTVFSYQRRRCKLAKTGAHGLASVHYVQFVVFSFIRHFANENGAFVVFVLNYHSMQNLFNSEDGSALNKGLLREYLQRHFINNLYHSVV